MTSLADYCDKYENLRMRREDGILEVVLHTDDGPMLWSPKIHRELPRAWGDIGADPDNKVIILTNAGGAFCERFSADRMMAGAESPDDFNAIFYRMFWEAKRLLQNQLEVDVPMIAAIDGPALLHAEIGLLCDIVLASDATVFADIGHVVNGIGPGDGVQIIWPLLIGLNRARYFLMTGQRIHAAQALALGVVNEVLPREKLLARAWELARELTTRSPLALRYTRLILLQSLKAQLASEWVSGAALEGLSMAASRYAGGRIDIG